MSATRVVVIVVGNWVILSVGAAAAWSYITRQGRANDLGPKAYDEGPIDGDQTDEV